jgi:hypothetical protein
MIRIISVACFLFTLNAGMQMCSAQSVGMPSLRSASTSWPAQNKRPSIWATASKLGSKTPCGRRVGDQTTCQRSSELRVPTTVFGIHVRDRKASPQLDVGYWEVNPSDWEVDTSAWDVDEVKWASPDDYGNISKIHWTVDQFVLRKSWDVDYEGEYVNDSRSWEPIVSSRKLREAVLQKLIPE